MKNNITKVMLITLALGMVLTLTGCKKDKKKEVNVNDYIKEEFKNEKVEVTTKDEDKKVYTAKNEDTGIEFTVKEVDGKLVDNYEREALKVYLKEYNDSKITLAKEDSDTKFVTNTDLQLKVSSGTSDERIAEILSNFAKFLKTKKPFEKELNIDVDYYKGSVYQGSVSLSENVKIMKSNIEDVK